MKLSFKVRLIQIAFMIHFKLGAWALNKLAPKAEK